MRPEELAARLQSGAFAAMKERVMRKATLLALRASQAHTPVRTGTLRRSETTRVEQGGMRGFIGANVEYAPFVHERIPFFQLGIEDARAEIEKALAQEAERFLDEVAG